MDLVLGVLGSQLLLLLFEGASAGRIGQYGVITSSYCLRPGVWFDLPIVMVIHWGALSLLDHHLVLEVIACVLRQVCRGRCCCVNLSISMLALVALAVSEGKLERIFILAVVLVVIEAGDVLGERDADLGELAVERLGFLDVILADELNRVEAALDLPLSRPDDGQLADTFFDLVLELGALEEG